MSHVAFLLYKFLGVRAYPGILSKYVCVCVCLFVPLQITLGCVFWLWNWSIKLHRNSMLCCSNLEYYATPVFFPCMLHFYLYFLFIPICIALDILYWFLRTEPISSYCIFIGNNRLMFYFQVICDIAFWRSSSICFSFFWLCLCRISVQEMG